MSETINKKFLLKVLITLLVYTAFIIIGELTCGNPKFPFHLWTFEKINIARWIIPVHLIGFIWLVLWNKILLNKSFILLMIITTLFFIIAETLNLLVLHFFSYSSDIFPAFVSFLMVLGTYIILCFICNFILHYEKKL